ncbi:MAG: Iron-sulfur cluster-binding protein, partial [uncultured Thermomicrobiales bacterium]
MELNGKTVLVCACEGTMALDHERLGCAKSESATQLCRAEMGRFTRALEAGRPIVLGCTQEAPVFEEARLDAGSPVPVTYVNIRERAGWSDEGRAAGPKMAALLAEAALDLPTIQTVPLKSEGVALIYGRDERAIEVAQQLKDRLDITVLLTRPGEILPPRQTEFPVLKGTIRSARGHLGAFEVEVDDYAAPLPSSRGSLVFDLARNGAKSTCDIVIDLSGGAPLFPGHGRDGYLRADLNSVPAVAALVLKAGDLVGEFDKPRFVDYRAELCAHSRSKRTGCVRCLEVCPTGAITPAGDHVAIDPYVCMGCGSCSAVCPTGAATYALPKPAPLVDRLRTLLLAYQDAGGAMPVILVHDGEHGAPFVELLGRHGAGLPARVLPFTVTEVTQIGLDFLGAAFAYGAAEVRFLVTGRRRDDLAPLARVIDYADAILAGLGFGPGRIGVIDTDDPDVLGEALRQIEARDGGATRRFAAIGDKRGLTRLALSELHAGAPAPVDLLALPAGAPFGRIEVKTDGCTLCLSCVAACPTAAIQDNPDKPALLFLEDACVQCGICANTCPESVISLE